MKISTDSFEPAALGLEETLYHTANGYLGVRGNFEEGYAEGVDTIRGCYINAFYDMVDIKHPEKLFGFPETAQRIVNLPDSQTTRIYLDDEVFSLFCGEVLSYRRELDMEAGVATRRVRWRSPKGKTAELSFTRLVSFTRQELFFTEIAVESDTFRELKLISRAHCDVTNYFNEADPRMASEAGKYLTLIDTGFCGIAASACCTTSQSGLSVAVAMGHAANVPADIRTEQRPDGFQTEITLALKGKAVVGKFCTYSDSRRHPDCKERALSVLEKAMSDGADAVFSEQRDYLDAFWAECGVVIHGAREISDGMAFNLYGLLQSAGSDSISNIPAKGLSGEGYEGHYFWDTEIYMLPFFLLTRPEQAKTLLSYRHYILDGAREHARTMGHSAGALYAWRTITGTECSPYYPSGSAQYHINGDIARSFARYYDMTGDIAFMAEKGAEVLVEIARLWMDVAAYDRKGRLCIHNVTGPDEYTCLVNNNYFTNLCAKNSLLDAVYICGELQREDLFRDVSKRLAVTADELKAFEKAAADLYIPYDVELDINPQDDSFLDKQKWDLQATPKENFPLLTHYHPLHISRKQVCKQADTILAHYLFEDAALSTMRNSYEYYEPLTTHDSSLSSCVFSVMASRLGKPKKAFNYFMDTIRTDLDNTHGNTRDGLHAANMGGAYLALTAGFAGLRIRRDGIHLRFSLPEAWDGYEFNIRFRDSLLNISVSAGKARITLKRGKPVMVFVEEPLSSSLTASSPDSSALTLTLNSGEAIAARVNCTSVVVLPVLHK